MKRIISFILLFAFVLAGVPTVCAQEPVITVAFDKEEVTVGEKFSMIISAQGNGLQEVSGQLELNMYVGYNTSQLGFDSDSMRYTFSFNPDEGPFVLECTAKKKGDVNITLYDVEYTDVSAVTTVGNLSRGFKIRPVYTYIYTKEELYNMRNNLSGDYMLMNDLEFTQEDFAQGGAFYGDGFGWIPIGAVPSNPFKGSFNGNGHSITGLMMNKAYYDFGGLFGVSRGEIENLRIKEAIINGEYGINTSVPALDDEIDKTNVDYEDKEVWTPSDGEVTEESLNQYDRTGVSTATVGIICGYNLGKIKNCFAGGSVNGNTYVGAIAGRNTGTVSGCASNATVMSKSVAGGVVGIAGSSAAIIDSVSQGRVTGAIAGGIIGEAKTTCNVTRVYTICDVTGGTSKADFGSGTPMCTEVYALPQGQPVSLVFTAGDWSYSRIIPYPKSLEDLLPFKEVEQITGDVDGDGAVNTIDLAKLKLYLSGDIHQTINGDVDGDLSVDIIDLGVLKLILSGA